MMKSRKCGQGIVVYVLISTLAASMMAGAPALAASLNPRPAVEVFEFDKGHTEIRFEYDHLAMSKQSGEFRKFDGKITWDRKNIEKSSVNVVIGAASVSTGFTPLDDHLKSADFFEVEKHPEIIFRSTKVRQIGARTGKVTGNLTIRDITRSVTLDVRFNFYGVHPLAELAERYAGAPYASFSARAQVLRTDFGVGLYSPGTSNKIDIVIETELRRQN